MLTRNLLTACFTLWMSTVVVGTHYPSSYFLDSRCQRQIIFQESMLLQYSSWGYTTISAYYNCPVTISGTSPGRGIQVRFRRLETTSTSQCSQVRLTVNDRRGSLTPTNGVCGYILPPTLRTTDDSVSVTLFSGVSFLQYGDFELLLTEFTFLRNGNCTGSDFKCNNNICISSELKCNGYNDCDDNSDEIEGCGLTTLTAGIIVGIAFAIICFLIFVSVVGVVFRRRRRYITIVG